MLSKGLKLYLFSTNWLIFLKINSKNMKDLKFYIVKDGLVEFNNSKENTILQKGVIM
jgi:hypothetical protein